jgi:hypothetical protein
VATNSFDARSSVIPDPLAAGARQAKNSVHPQIILGRDQSGSGRGATAAVVAGFAAVVAAAVAAAVAPAATARGSLR